MIWDPKKSVTGALITFIFLLLQVLGPDHSFSQEGRVTNSLGMEFVLISPGAFMMGSPADEPRRNKDETQHPVTIAKSFYMQSTEVTLKQWWAVMGKGFFFQKRGKENMPVVKISWFDCIAFIDRLNKRNEGIYRLPTEAEWEYACRAGSPGPYSWGHEVDCTKAMFSNNTLKSPECISYVKSRGLDVDMPAPAGSYPPNPWGLYDMSGNVWEWCQDWYGPYPNGKVVDPEGPDSGDHKVRRGGSWFREGWLLRSANRNMAHPSSKYETLGFRTVREVVSRDIGNMKR